MTTPRLIPIAVVTLTSLATCPVHAQAPNPESARAIADTVSHLFAVIPAATNRLDLDALLALYRPSDELTYVAAGRIVRSFAAMQNLVHQQFDSVTAADLRWQDPHVEVLTNDVAIATARFELTATVAGGATARSAGTYTAVYVRRDGDWKIEYSMHTFPRPRT